MRMDGDNRQCPKRCKTEQLMRYRCTKQQAADEMKMMQPPTDVFMVDAPPWPHRKAV
jgi:hypothetical protein